MRPANRCAATTPITTRRRSLGNPSRYRFHFPPSDRSPSRNQRREPELRSRQAAGLLGCGFRLSSRYSARSPNGRRRSLREDGARTRATNDSRQPQPGSHQPIGLAAQISMFHLSRVTPAATLPTPGWPESRPEFLVPMLWFLTWRSEEHTSELQSQSNLVCRLLLEKKKTRTDRPQKQRRELRQNDGHGGSVKI